MRQSMENLVAALSGVSSTLTGRINRKMRRTMTSTRFRHMKEQAETGLSPIRREILLDNGKTIHPTKGYGSAHRSVVAPTSLRKKG